MASRDRLSIPESAYLLIGKRDNWTCRICGQGYRPLPDWKWEIDHWIARANGGTDHLPNLVLAHRRCNRDKAAA